MLVPHDFQYAGVQSIFDYFNAKTGNPILALPTGTGKSIVIAEFLKQVFKQYPRQKVLCLTHVKELVAQNAEKMMRLWPGAPIGINSSGLGQRDVHNPIIFAGIASVAKLWHQFGFIDLIIIDECHLVSPNDETMYRRFIDNLKTVNPYLKVIGLTATPYRLGLGHITEGKMFTDVCFDLTGVEAFNWLIHEGYLSQLIPKRTQTILDVDGVRMRGGEFIASELQRAVDRDVLTERACRETIELAEDRNHWLSFCSGVEHAIHTADMLNSMGVPSIAIYSKMGNSERDKAIRAWKHGEYKCATNNDVLTTGIDFPLIDLIQMLRPTASPSLWVQMLGRGTRPVYAPGYNISIREQRLLAVQRGGKRDCLVLDYAGNTARLGPINDPVLPCKRGEKGGDAPVRICDMCGTYNHASVRVCIGCGHVFPVQNKLKQGASTDELIIGDLPKVEVFTVDHISYALHEKLGSQPSIRVTYYAGLKHFTEFVCIQHQGWAHRRANTWWSTRTNIKMPGTTEEALNIIDQVQVATHLRVWINKKHPEILAHCFDGTAFNTREVKDSDEPPAVDVVRRKSKTAKQTDEFYEDDIPF